MHCIRVRSGAPFARLSEFLSHSNTMSALRREALRVRDGLAMRDGLSMRDTLAMRVESASEALRVDNAVAEAGTLVLVLDNRPAVHAILGPLLMYDGLLMMVVSEADEIRTFVDSKRVAALLATSVATSTAMATLRSCEHSVPLVVMLEANGTAPRWSRAGNEMESHCAALRLDGRLDSATLRAALQQAREVMRQAHARAPDDEHHAEPPSSAGAAPDGKPLSSPNTVTAALDERHNGVAPGVPEYLHACDANEIVPSTRFLTMSTHTRVSLNHAGLSAAAATALGAWLRRNLTCERLELNRNRLGAGGVDAIADALQASAHPSSSPSVGLLPPRPPLTSCSSASSLV